MKTFLSLLHAIRRFTRYRLRRIEYLFEVVHRDRARQQTADGPSRHFIEEIDGSDRDDELLVMDVTFRMQEEFHDVNNCTSKQIQIETKGHISKVFKSSLVQKKQTNMSIELKTIGRYYYSFLFRKDWIFTEAIVHRWHSTKSYDAIKASHDITLGPPVNLL